MLQLSFSQVKLFKTSPLDYFYKYVKKYKEKGQETKWCNFGNAVHECLEEYYNKSNTNWQQNSIDKWAKYKLEGRMNFDEFKKNIINGIMLGLNPTKVEKKILLSVTDKVTFLGYLDVYSDKDDYIIDWKTGTYTKQKEDEYKKQLLCYSWMFNKINNRLPKVCSIFFVKNSKKIDFTFSLNEVLEYEKDLIKTAEEIINKKKYDIKAEQWGNTLSFFSGYHYLNNLPLQRFNIEINGSYCTLKGSISPLLIKGIDKSTYFDLPGKYFIQKNYIGKVTDIDEIGRIHLYNKRTNTFNIGLLAKIKKLIIDYGEYKNIKVDIIINDFRDKNVTNFELKNLPDKLNTDKELRPYQLQAISSFFRSDGMGFLEIATGGGKTLITAEIIRRLKTSTLWIIDKKELLYQTKKVFENVLNTEIGIIGDGEFNPKSITVSTIQTLNKKVDKLDEKCLNYLQKVNFAIVDEFQHAASKSYVRVFKCLKNTKYRLGTTATAFRDDGKAPIMFSLIGDVIYKINSQELISQGYLVKPNISFYRINNKIDFKLEIAKETKRLISKVEYSEEYGVGIVNNNERNNKIFEIVKNNIDKKILIIVKYIEHGKYLNSLINNSKYIYGDLNKKDRKEYLESFLNSDKNILIATSPIASEGLDIPDLNMIINASANKSDVKSIQALGRILRKIEGKTEAEYIDFIDIGRFGKKHSNLRLKIFRDQGYKINII